MTVWVWSPLIPVRRRGTVWGGLAHASDWLPTFGAIAGVCVCVCVCVRVCVCARACVCVDEELVGLLSG